MIQFEEHPQAAEQDIDTVNDKDRRRSRRNDRVNSQLIPLLRSSAMMDVPVQSLDEVDAPFSADDLKPARSIAVSLMMSLPLWVVIVEVVRALE